MAATSAIITQQQHVTFISPWQMALLAGNLSTWPSPSDRSGRGQGHIACNEQLTQVLFYHLPNPPGHRTPDLVPQDCLQPFLQGPASVVAPHQYDTYPPHQPLAHYYARARTPAAES